ncbi:LAME_0A03158g1_1 [Lachancea meyersii CBS 8951]|uniref:LAME_0A03158g1_1 n=1 Tax=Lachancea meyersii CBS 8951 TaxID=1266667 RepID=A0A1G4IN29_9SACH|nr:LAME_0A03158g1_1 [Lachancea meyersii CBS 8951]
MNRNQLVAERDNLLADYNDLLLQAQRLQSKQLIHKYDALPLLDLPTRLQCLQQLYPLLKIHSFQSSQPEHHHHQQSAVHVTFSIDNLSIALRYATRQSQITHLSVTHVSPSRIPLEPLTHYCEQTLNLPFLLSGCYEYARLARFRTDLWEKLTSSFSYLTAHLRSQRNCLQLSSQKSNLTLDVYFFITFDRLPFPSSTVNVKLASEMGSIPHANEVCSALIKEYGLEHGLHEFIKAVMS